eukprot:scaffold6145_cov102-Isochrysis_galbana.AAC.1
MPPDAAAGMSRETPSANARAHVGSEGVELHSKTVGVDATQHSSRAILLVRLVALLSMKTWIPCLEARRRGGRLTME